MSKLRRAGLAVATLWTALLLAFIAQDPTPFGFGVLLAVLQCAQGDENAEEAEEAATSNTQQAARVSLHEFADPQGPIQLRQRCPFCHDHLLQPEPRLECPGCKAVYHAECLHESRGACLTLGCRLGARAA
jgi:hypothetical protein